MNLKKALKISIFTLLWTARSAPMVPCPAKSAEPEGPDRCRRNISFDAPFPASKYKTALDTCMQVWGDVCVLRDSQEINAERSLLIDAALGRLVYLESAVGEIFAAEQVAKPKDADVAYLSNLVTRLETCCEQLAERDQNERVKCFKPLVQNIKGKLNRK